MGSKADEDAIYRVIESIQNGGDETVLQGFVCPECGAQMEVAFHPSGKNLSVSCSSDSFHWCWNGKVVRLPNWWKAKIQEEGWFEFGGHGQSKPPSESN